MSKWFSNLFRHDIYDALWHGMPINEESGVREIVPFIITWKITARRLRTFQISLGFLATFFSILTATSIGLSSDYYSKFFAFIAAVSIGLMTAFDLGTKSNNMTNAWRHLVAAVVKFNNGIIKKQAVIDAYIEAEKLIGDVTFQQTGGPIRPTPAPTPTPTPIPPTEQLPPGPPT